VPQDRKNGAKLIKNGDVILTHCNAGILATSSLGTALSPLYEAKRQGKHFKVYADETRRFSREAVLPCGSL